MHRLRLLALALLLASPTGAQANPQRTSQATSQAGPQATSQARPRTTSQAGPQAGAGVGAPIDSADLDRRTREVATQLRCPVCQGESIQESPAELAQEMKAVVREQLAAGRTPDEVKAFFVARYGEWILLEPVAGGFNAMLYVLPPLVLLAGGALVVVLARRWARAGAAAPSDPAPPDHAG